MKGWVLWLDGVDVCDGLVSKTFSLSMSATPTHPSMVSHSPVCFKAIVFVATSISVLVLLCCPTFCSWSILILDSDRVWGYCDSNPIISHEGPLKRDSISEWFETEKKTKNKKEEKELPEPGVDPGSSEPQSDILPLNYSGFQVIYFQIKVLLIDHFVSDKNHAREVIYRHTSQRQLL